MNKIEGMNLIDLAEKGVFDAIIHGCNCFHTMGAGIAKEIKERYPQAYNEDKKTPYGSRLKLGNYSFTIIDSPTDENPDHFFYIINGYTQFHYKKSKTNLDENYKAISDLFERISNDFVSQRIGFPMIGAGLAGGDWNIISKIIEEKLGDNLVYTLVTLK
ncbi:MAG: macro domain-containing protein [Nanoarchaeota archaeon]